MQLPWGLASFSYDGEAAEYAIFMVKGTGWQEDLVTTLLEEDIAKLFMADGNFPHG